MSYKTDGMSHSKLANLIPNSYRSHYNGHFKVERSKGMLVACFHPWWEQVLWPQFSLLTQARTWPWLLTYNLTTLANSTPRNLTMPTNPTHRHACTDHGHILTLDPNNELDHWPQSWPLSWVQVQSQCRQHPLIKICNDYATRLYLIIFWHDHTCSTSKLKLQQSP